MGEKETKLSALAEILDGKLLDLEATLAGTYGTLAKAMEAKSERGPMTIVDGLDAVGDSLQKSIDRCDYLREQIQRIADRV